MTASMDGAGVAAVQLPASWFDEPLPVISTVADCAKALRADGPQLRRILTRGPARAAKEFQDQLRHGISGESGHVLIEFPSHVSAALACTLFAAWLGVLADAVHDDLGGTVSHVVSGAGNGHDQAWHTDSTQWSVPNRYTLLGLLSGSGSRDMPTGVLPIHHLDDLLFDDQEALLALRGEALPWRVKFPELPQLWGSILDPAVPRWVRPVVDPLRPRMTPALAKGVDLLEAALADEVPCHEPSTVPGRLVMFDNYRVMHRGPRVEQSQSREVIRIKIGGRP